jgi:hypothetical protein
MWQRENAGFASLSEGEDLHGRARESKPGWGQENKTATQLVEALRGRI